MMLESSLVNGSCFKCAIEIECVLYEMHMKRCVSVQEHGSADPSTGQLVCRRFLSQSEACSPGRDRRDVRRETGHGLRSPAHRRGQASSVYSAL